MKGTIWLVESHLKFVMRRLMNYSWVRMFTSNLTHGWWRERNVSESTVGYRRWPCINRTLNMWEIFVNLTCINSTPVYRNKPSHFFNFLTQQGLSWLYGSWVYYVKLFGICINFKLLWACQIFYYNHIKFYCCFILHKQKLHVKYLKINHCIIPNACW